MWAPWVPGACTLTDLWTFPTEKKKQQQPLEIPKNDAATVITHTSYKRERLSTDVHIEKWPCTEREFCIPRVKAAMTK